MRKSWGTRDIAASRQCVATSGEPNSGLPARRGSSISDMGHQELMGQPRAPAESTRSGRFPVASSREYRSIRRASLNHIWPKLADSANVRDCLSRSYQLDLTD